MPDTLNWIRLACNADRRDPNYCADWTIEEAISGHALLEKASRLWKRKSHRGNGS